MVDNGYSCCWMMWNLVCRVYGCDGFAVTIEKNVAYPKCFRWMDNIWFVCNVTSNQFGPYRMCSLLGSVQSAFLSLCLMYLGSVFVLFRFCFYIFFIFCLSFWKWIFLFSSFFSAELNKYITTHYWLIIGIQVHFVFFKLILKKWFWFCELVFKNSKYLTNLQGHSFLTYVIIKMKSTIQTILSKFSSFN